jgi:hypothetical protein
LVQLHRSIVVREKFSDTAIALLRLVSVRWIPSTPMVLANAVFQRVFQEDNLVLTREMTAHDVAKWDSLRHQPPS